MFLGVNRLRCGGPGRGSLPAWPSWKLRATGSPVLHSISLKPACSCPVCPRSDSLRGRASRQPGADWEACACITLPIPSHLKEICVCSVTPVRSEQGPAASQEAPASHRLPSAPLSLGVPSTYRHCNIAPHRLSAMIEVKV